MKNRLSVFHPIPIGLFPILSLYLFNIDQILINSLVSPLIAGLILSAFIWLVSGLVMKSFQKSAIFTSIFLIIFYSYGHIRLGTPILVMILSFLMITGIFIVVFKSKSKFKKLHLFFNVFSLVLLSTVLFQIIPYEYGRARDLTPNIVRPIEEIDEKPDQTPDIYYLIFDRYPNYQVLDKYLDHDNSEFIDHLENIGFYVANKSFSNYPKTFNSLASSLNFEYLDFLVEEFGEDYTDRSPYYQLMNNNKVLNFLKEQGYTTYHFGDWWQPTRINPYADVNYNYFIINLNEFTQQLVATTLAGPFYNYFFLSGESFGGQPQRIVPGREFSYVSTKREVIERNEYRMERFQQLPELPGPKFVYAHILLPHDPFVFDPDCQPVDDDFQATLERDQKFVNQLICVNQLIKQKVDYILTQSVEDPIIILSSDEGPFPRAIWSGEKAYGELNAEETEMKFGILNAFYLPGFDEDNLYQSISPVNTFRIIFNHYFGTDYQILEDRHFNMECERTPNKLFEVFFK